MRVSDAANFAPPIVVCHESHRFLVSEQLRGLRIEDATLIVEPVARNTAPALALAALHASRYYPDSILVVLPSDHRIAKPDVFSEVVKKAAEAANHGWLVAFGITPKAAETGFGYIKAGTALEQITSLHRIERFVEKPDRVTAEAYLAQGHYIWNSGMFVMAAARYMSELQTYEPAIFACCSGAYEARTNDDLFLHPNAEALSDCPVISIDHAVMERTAYGAVLSVDLTWSDLGSWRAIDDISEKDEARNAVCGPALLHHTQNCYIHSETNLIATCGVRDLVIVAADRAILVGHKDALDEMKPLLETMRARALPDVDLQTSAHRPWGRFDPIDAGPGYKVKKLQLKPGGKISLQSHTHRSEHWVVVAGRATVTNGDSVTILNANQSTYIPAGTTHRLENAEETDLIVIEVQTGDYLGEDDIKRHEDLYRRADSIHDCAA